MDPNTQKSASASGERKRSSPRPPRFDTMRAVRNLKEAEFREQQAVAIVETIRDAQTEFATRDDLYAGLEKLELILRGEISEFRSEMRGEISEFRSEMRGEISESRSEMRGAIDNLRSEMQADMQAQLATMQWRFLIGVSVIVGIFGTIITLAGGR